VDHPAANFTLRIYVPKLGSTYWVARPRAYSTAARSSGLASRHRMYSITSEQSPTARAVILFFTEPYERSRCALVDGPHAHDLAAFFLVVGLVHIDCVDAKHRGISLCSCSKEEVSQVSLDLEPSAITSDLGLIVGVAPAVR
jgi:hypothetical protein